MNYEAERGTSFKLMYFFLLRKIRILRQGIASLLCLMLTVTEINKCILFSKIPVGIQYFYVDECHGDRFGVGDIIIRFFLSEVVD